MAGQDRGHAERAAIINLPRLLNSIADVYGALRLAGWSAEEAARITTEAARDVVNRIPSKPYPDYKDITHDHRDRNPRLSDDPE